MPDEPRDDERTLAPQEREALLAITAYQMGELSEGEQADVERRMDEDEAFARTVAPVLLAQQYVRMDLARRIAAVDAEAAMQRLMARIWEEERGGGGRWGGGGRGGSRGGRRWPRWVRRTLTVILVVLGIFVALIGRGLYRLARDSAPARPRTVEPVRDVAFTSDGVTLHTLGDGTGVTLNAGSRLAYRSSLDTATARDVALTGEGLFAVPAVGGTGRPFTVTTRLATANTAIPLTVATAATQGATPGATFDVRAYPDERFARVVVLRGVVALRGANGDSAVTIPAGRTALVAGDGTVTVAPANLHDVAWRSGSVTLVGAALPVALAEITHRYGVVVRVCDGVRPQDRVTLTLHDQPLDTVLDAVTVQTHRGVNHLRPGLIGLGAQPDLVNGTAWENVRLALRGLAGLGCSDVR